MPNNPVIKFNGMNNKTRPEELGLDKLAHAENVQFSNQGELIIPGQAFVPVYTNVGSCHSVNNSLAGILYSDSSNLYKYAATPVTLKSSVGANAFSFTRPIGTTVYFSNGTVTGKYRKGESAAREWGTPAPSANPTVAAIATGGMDAGTYRVTTTWIADEESGAANSVEVEVAAGGGIALSAFPSDYPSYVTKFAVWCTQANGKDLYLYNEYAIGTSSVTITRFKGTIVLDTQFCIHPQPAANAPMVDHYGRIYWGDSEYLRYTHIGRFGPAYGLADMFNYFGPFDSAVQTIVSCPGVLYVGTLNNLYRITNIDGDGPAMLEPLQACGSVRGSECYDPDGITAYFMSYRGFISATPEGLQELSYNDVAIPIYAYGSSTVTELDGLKYLFFYGFTGTENSLALSAWNNAESFPQNSGWAINLSTGAVSKYVQPEIKNINNGYAGSTRGISVLSDYKAQAGIAKTGKYDFDENRTKRIDDIYIESQGDEIDLRVITDNSEPVYTIGAAEDRGTVNIDIARGQRGRYWQFEFRNEAGSGAIISEMSLHVIGIPRHK